MHANLWTILGNMLLLQGTLVVVLEANAATWSLAIEEILYFLSPIFKKLPSSLLLIFISLSSLLYVFSGKLGITRFAGEIAGRGFICCAWAWLLGFLFYRKANETWIKNIFILLPVFLMGASNQLLGKTQCFVVAAVALILIYSPQIKPYSLLTNRVFQWLGNVSFPLYICHYPLVFILPLILTKNPYTYLIITCTLSVGVYHLIDAPNRERWKKPFSLFKIYNKNLQKDILEDVLKSAGCKKNYTDVVSGVKAARPDLNSAL